LSSLSRERLVFVIAVPPFWAKSTRCVSATSQGNDGDHPRRLLCFDHTIFILLASMLIESIISCCADPVSPRSTMIWSPAKRSEDEVSLELHIAAATSRWRRADMTDCLTQSHLSTPACVSSGCHGRQLSNLAEQLEPGHCSCVSNDQQSGPNERDCELQREVVI
jgi:hypothetical protein